MTKPLYIICGKSASGKDSIVTALCKLLNKKQVVSYTTRQKRYRGENTHYFISKEEFLEFENNGQLAAYTEYNGNYYGATFEEVDASDFYILDPEGIHYFLERYKTDRPIYSLYIDADYAVREQRMKLSRPNSLIENEERLTHDDVIFHQMFINQYTDVTIKNNKDDQGIEAITCALLWIQSKEIQNKDKFVWWTNEISNTAVCGFYLPKTRNPFKGRKIKQCLQGFNIKKYTCKLFSWNASGHHLNTFVSYELPITESNMYKQKSLLITLDYFISEYLGGHCYE